jgi:glycosyltransferase involved in cell wall biosynthesis
MKLFAVGIGPVPFESSSTLYGLGHRTWNLVKPLVDDGHQVRLVAGRIPSASELGLNLPVVQLVLKTKALEYIAINEMQPFLELNEVRKLYEAFEPDCSLGINGLAASVLSRLHPAVPFWADLNGWLMAEAQSKAKKINSDTPLDEFWAQEEIIVKTADVFSTVSIPQKYALLGELAALGRLTAINTGYEFVYHIPNAIETTPEQHTNQVVRDQLGQEPFIILWSGGYNTWTDIETLFTGLTKAMERNDRIRFVSTGGILRGHDEKTYLRFQILINESKYRDRFILHGWVPSEEVNNYYFESDLGINIDIFNYETVFGARNRLLHMMKYGLPVITTCGTEISNVIQENQLGLTFEIGNAEQLTDQILYAGLHQDELKSMGLKAKQFVYDHYTSEKTAMPVRKWMKEPKFAPDTKSKKSEVRGQKSEIDTSSPITILKSLFKKR